MRYALGSKYMKKTYFGPRVYKQDLSGALAIVDQKLTMALKVSPKRSRLPLVTKAAST